ncbi:MAG TPA: hypothetical protein GX504_08440 [Clostridia bacterium]|nr:hypothetical protein [Clostridia bacterium]
MFLVISVLAMMVTALLAQRFGLKFLSYTALGLGTITSFSLCALTVLGIAQGITLS